MIKNHSGMLMQGGQPFAQAFSQIGPAVRGGHFALRRGPDRRREVAVVSKARDHMPVQMRHDIAQAGQVDFVRAQHLA